MGNFGFDGFEVAASSSDDVSMGQALSSSADRVPMGTGRVESDVAEPVPGDRVPMGTGHTGSENVGEGEAASTEFLHFLKDEDVEMPLILEFYWELRRDPVPCNER